MERIREDNPQQLRTLMSSFSTNEWLCNLRWNGSSTSGDGSLEATSYFLLSWPQGSCSLIWPKSFFGYEVLILMPFGPDHILFPIYDVVLILCGTCRPHFPSQPQLISQSWVSAYSRKQFRMRWHLWCVLKHSVHGGWQCKRRCSTTLEWIMSGTQLKGYR